MHETTQQTLAGVPRGGRARILDIHAGRSVRQHLAALGIHPGDEIAVLQTPPGPFLVEIHGSRVALGAGVADKIHVDLL